MGDIADMMLDGTLCESCGVVFDDRQSPGYPRYCDDCQQEGRAPKVKTPCAVCGRRVKVAGMTDHMRAVHDLP